MISRIYCLVTVITSLCRFLLPVMELSHYPMNQVPTKKREQLKTSTNTYSVVGCDTYREPPSEAVT